MGLMHGYIILIEGPSATYFADVPSSAEDISDLDREDIVNPLLHLDPEPIPDLPTDPEVHAKHVLPEDVVHYIKPLYTRLWGIGTGRFKYDRGGKMVSRMLPQLSKGFSFAQNATTLQFISDVTNIARGEEASPIF
jgi:hypothetical protein